MNNHWAGRHCVHCQNVTWDNGDASVGMDGYYICKFQNEADFAPGVFEMLEGIEWHEQKAPLICGRYADKPTPCCGVCGDEIPHPLRTSTVIGKWTYIHMYADAEPVCDNLCKEAAAVILQREKEEHQQAIEEMPAWAI